jgi:hypothetical protein
VPFSTEGHAVGSMLEWLLAPFYEILRRMLTFLGLASSAASLEQKGTQVKNFSHWNIVIRRAQPRSSTTP